MTPIAKGGIVATKITKEKTIIELIICVRCRCKPHINICTAAFRLTSSFALKTTLGAQKSSKTAVFIDEIGF